MNTVPKLADLSGAKAAEDTAVHLAGLIEAIDFAAQRRKGIGSIADEAEAKLAVEVAREAWGRVILLACAAADFLRKIEEAK